MAIQDVVVVSVPVSDQDRAKAFYVDTLGFELQREDDSIPGLRWVQVAPKGAGTALTLVTWFDSMPPGSLQGLVLTSSNLQADYEELVAKGSSSTGRPSSSRGPPRRSCTTPTGTASSSSKPEDAQPLRAGPSPWLAPHAAKWQTARARVSDPRLRVQVHGRRGCVVRRAGGLGAPLAAVTAGGIVS